MESGYPDLTENEDECRDQRQKITYRLDPDELFNRERSHRKEQEVTTDEDEQHLIQYRDQCIYAEQMKSSEVASQVGDECDEELVEDQNQQHHELFVAVPD